MTIYQCVRCGQDLRLSEECPLSSKPSQLRGELCSKCALSLSDEEQYYY